MHNDAIKSDFQSFDYSWIDTFPSFFPLIDKQVEYVAHQTKSFMATLEGNLQKAVRERILAINEQCK